MNTIQLVGKDPQVKGWIDNLEEKMLRQLITGLTGSAKTLPFARVFKRTDRSMIILMPNLHYANQLAEDLQHVIPQDRIRLFPVDEVLSAEMTFSSPEAQGERVATPNALQGRKAGIYLLPVAALHERLPNRKTWLQAQLNWHVDDGIDVENLPRQPTLVGYVREEMVAEPGEFSIRGSIADIYPLATDYPIRVELFNVEIDSMRYSETGTQRSIEKTEEIWVSPASGRVYGPEDLEHGTEQMQKMLEKRLVAITEEADREFLQDYFGQIAPDWQVGIPTGEARFYSDLLYQEFVTILDYFPSNSLLVVDDYQRIMETDREIEKEAAEWYTQEISELRVFSEQSFSADVQRIVQKEKFTTTFFSLFQRGMGGLHFQAVHSFQYRTMQQFFEQMPLLKTEMDRWHRQEQTVVIFTPTKDGIRKAGQMLRDEDTLVVEAGKNALIRGRVQLIGGALQAGFELPQEKIVAIAEKGIFQKTTRRQTRRQTVTNAERLKSYNELKAGDYAIHANHGIGKYIGMEILEVNGVHQDYMAILYQNDDRLFVPVTQLDLIQRYVASETKTPRINKLGGSEQAKTERKVSPKIEDIADDLIRLYAVRESKKGCAFGPDDACQKEFEDAFPHSEAGDQLRSAMEIKRDMEKEKPMDRLLVGDVGYGETGVALRAAFKAIKESKQVAFLIPTTVLTQRHYETMLERSESFPIGIRLLSRFRTRKQQKETIKQLRTGQVDIVVGTHRVLSKDTEFSDLDLLIIGEEQRFDVKHEERLKQLRTQVDVLILTTTPIPRILHISVLGVQDLSVIETPPANRYPIQTYVMGKNPEAIREAIHREMGRDGQALYLYNRVETIGQKVKGIQELVPEAQIGYAHGQTTEAQLENTLFEFIEGQYDVLVTTTTIEIGIDIPSADTLFVENVDCMGLSTLYQLRGRVGGSSHVAYAYFMYEQQEILNEASEKRPQTIKGFTELGSGFRVAMRDLSIRGAGNFLDVQQHGFIGTVGFDMYS